MSVETTEGAELYLCFLEFLRCPKGLEEHCKSFALLTQSENKDNTLFFSCSALPPPASSLAQERNSTEYPVTVWCHCKERSARMSLVLQAGSHLPTAVHIEIFVHTQPLSCVLSGSRHSSFKIKPLYHVRVTPTDFPLCITAFSVRSAAFWSFCGHFSWFLTARLSVTSRTLALDGALIYLHFYYI